MSILTYSEENQQPCPLCEMQSSLYDVFQNRKYFSCNNCCSIFLDPNCRLDEINEKNRYLEHNNDINDERYQKFVSPITNYVCENYSTNSIGLDFGAGTGPVISSILQEQGYDINKYDPFFSPDKKVFETIYDYIVCCEVIEHFYHPKTEFVTLFNTLQPGGEIICKTDLYDESIDFKRWYYKNDPAHVFFYSKKTFSWIERNLGFSHINIEGRIVILKK